MNKQEELKEQAKVVDWAREQGIKVSAIAQLTYIGSYHSCKCPCHLNCDNKGWSQINKNKKAGVEKGVPDLLMVIPKHLRRNNQSIVIFIEMKKEKGGVTSKEQKSWIESLNESEGVEARVCHGAKEAIIYLKSLIEIQPPVLVGEELENLIHNL